MTTEEKHFLVDRICQGGYYTTISYHGEDYDIYFRDPLRSDTQRAQWYVHKHWKDDDEETMTLEETYEVLKDQGLWSDELEVELEKTEKDLKQFKEALVTLQFQEQKSNLLRDMIRKAEDKYKKLNGQKNQLWQSSVEYMRIDLKRRFILNNCLLAKIISPFSDNLMSSSTFQNTLIVYYYDKEYPTEKDIREIARSDPLTLYWMVAKDTGTPLFKHPITDITDLQFQLLTWSKIYDWAYQHPDSPGDEIIHDDDQFDAWYKAQSSKDKLESQQSKIGKFKGDTVFIPADKEGAKKVYELNDASTRNTIKKRMEYIKQKGEVDDANLPDIKMDLLMKANRLESQRNNNTRKL